MGLDQPASLFCERDGWKIGKTTFQEPQPTQECKLISLSSGESTTVQLCSILIAIQIRHSQDSCSTPNMTCPESQQNAGHKLALLHSTQSMIPQIQPLSVHFPILDHHF
jgi:hypothetical protein